jgi:predicted O-methyltransferase YrrM
MKVYDIREKLDQLDFSLEEISLGDFDAIGEFTAKKKRDPNTDLYKTAGCFFRPNYERGILLYALVKKYNIQSYLEIGFGRGYSAFCVAKAMCDCGIDGEIVTIDPNFNEDHLKNLANVFPAAWFKKIRFARGTSELAMPEISNNFDIIYIDGDHRYEAVKLDWELTKDKFNKFIIFDDYHLPEISQKDIECARLVDEIENDSKELILMDRRIFFDDRGIKDDEIKYGQVIIKNSEFNESNYLLDW